MLRAFSQMISVRTAPVAALSSQRVPAVVEGPPRVALEPMSQPASSAAALDCLQRNRYFFHLVSVNCIFIQYHMLDQGPCGL